MSQSIEITAATGLTGLSARLFATASDTVVATASSVTAATNRKSIYVCAFSGVATGTYLLELLLGQVAVASRFVVIDGSSGTWTEYVAAGGEGATLSGPYARTIVVTDAANDAPIEGATVRLYRTGETESKTTNEDGETVPFSVGAFTYSYAIYAAGYAGATGTIVVSGDGTTTVELTANAPVSANAPECNLTIPVTTQFTDADTRADYRVEFVKFNTGASPGSIVRNLTLDLTASNGVLTCTIYRYARYRFSYKTKRLEERVVTFDVGNVGAFTLVEQVG